MKLKFLLVSALLIVLSNICADDEEDDDEDSLDIEKLMKALKADACKVSDLKKNKSIAKQGEIQNSLTI